MYLVQIKNWFLNQNLSSAQISAIHNGSEFFKEKETEKAILFLVKTDFGKFKFWVPKSVIVSMKER